MRDRMTRPPVLPINVQQIAIKLVDGREYVVCSRGQMLYLEQMAMVRLADDMRDEGVGVTKEALAERLGQWRRKCPYATIDYIMSQMTPAEREKWRAHYRFGGINRKWG